MRDAVLRRSTFMWHPPERIKHDLLPPRWPTADEAAAARWFSPLDSGRLRLRERTWVPAMVPWRATEDGLVTPEVLDWYARFAEGRPGAIVVEATGVRDIPSGPLLRVGHDRFIPGLTQLVDVVRRASEGQTRLFLQIIDFLAIRRRPDKTKYFERYLTLTDDHRAWVGPARSDAEVRQALLAMSDAEHEAVLTSCELEALRVGYRERVTDVDLPHVEELPRVLPEIFAAASARAEQAGFDGVELHYAHAYTMASFLSARNDRGDGYGGDRASRARLPLEVYRAVRARVTDPFVVGCRYLADECIDGGNGVDDAIHFGVAFAEAGFDFLSLSRGGKFEDAKPPEVGWAVYPYTGPSGWECMPTVLADRQGPFGRNVPPSGRIRRAVRAAGLATPIVVAGGIHAFDQAEAILQRGDADLVAAARQSLADPDWFRKIRAGSGDEVRRCVFTNYCEGLDQKHRPVSCKLWDRVGLDVPGLSLVDDGKRRLTAPRWEPR
jgi:2,4-dienoyl-CoA reductase-like NADH-dependent reductase (Old Yellow Enzyme family)